MLRGLYSAATALDAASQHQEVTAYNLAHATTPGYRQRGVTQETFDRALERAESPTGDLTGTKVVGVYHDLRPGALQQTGQPFDLALGNGEQFFTLAGPDGPIFSRNGSFRLNARSQIVSESGYPLRGQNGPITVPPETASVVVGVEGSVTADGQPIGQIQIARFTDPTKLTAIGPTLYSAGPDAGQLAANGEVLQGYREASNVQPADAMVRMIIGARYYDAAQRSLRTISESLQLNTRPQNG